MKYIKTKIEDFKTYIKNFEHADILPLLFDFSKWITIFLLLLLLFKFLGLITMSLLLCFSPIIIITLIIIFMFINQI